MHASARPSPPGDEVVERLRVGGYRTPNEGRNDGVPEGLRSKAFAMTNATQTDVFRTLRMAGARDASNPRGPRVRVRKPCPGIMAWLDTFAGQPGHARGRSAMPQFTDDVLHNRSVVPVGMVHAQSRVPHASRGVEDGTREPRTKPAGSAAGSRRRGDASPVPGRPLRFARTRPGPRTCSSRREVGSSAGIDMGGQPATPEDERSAAGGGAVVGNAGAVDAAGGNRGFPICRNFWRSRTVCGSPRRAGGKSSRA